MENREIEAKFLEIDKDALIKKLEKLGAEDRGEDILRELIFYDKEGRWRFEVEKFVRIRRTKEGTLVTFKHKEERSATGTKEIEFWASEFDRVKDFLLEIGLIFYREQEKRRRKFLLGDIIADIDTWPQIPTYLELEGPSEESLKEAAKKLDLDWSKAVFGLAPDVIEDYGIPVRKLKFFTFDKVE